MNSCHQWSLQQDTLFTVRIQENKLGLYLSRLS